MSGAFLTDDLADFLDDAEFADEATFDGATAPVLGIFDRAFELVAVGNSDVGAIGPVLVLRTADVPANAQGRYLRFGNLLAGGTRWRVANVHPDGTGVTVLQLHEA